MKGRKAAAKASFKSAAERSVAEERMRALRALLMSPLLVAGGADAEAFTLVRRHAAYLKEWFLKVPMWTLTVDPEVARLRKIPANCLDGTRAAQLPGPGGGVRLGRRSYMLLCLALAALERLDRQTTIGALAEGITNLALAGGASGGVDVDFSFHDQRRDLVQAIKLLGELRVLVKIDGDDSQFLHQRGDALYNINRFILGTMLVARNSPARIQEEGFNERLAAVNAELQVESGDGINRQVRTTLYRTLLDDPVLYFADCNEEERRYLQSQRAHLERVLSEATGLISEVRSEGMAMVDEGGHLGDVSLPEEGTEGHCTLLVAEFLALAQRERPGLGIGLTEIYAHVATLIGRYKGYWRKDTSLTGAEQGLAEVALRRLEALRLIERQSSGMVLPLPAIARYRLVEVPVQVAEAEASGEAMWS